MINYKHITWMIFTALFLVASFVSAGEPLVVKAGDGKYIPAVASKWTKAGENSFTFTLQTGTKASGVAAELKDKIAPIKVIAQDDSTLLFEGEKLSEQDLLEKLSGIALGKEKEVKDALAALSSLGDEGGPALSDLSSTGSIRASKGFDLPPAATRKKDSNNLIGEVVEVQVCEPLPKIVIRVIVAPEEGPGKESFPEGKIALIRGYYKMTNDKKLDKNDKRTAINIMSKNLKEGDQVYGKPYKKDGKIWIVETIEKMQ